MSWHDNDRGEANIIAMIGLVLFTVVAFFTILDERYYSYNYDIMSRVLREGADTVATFGGDGTAKRATVIESTYGVPIEEVRDLYRNSKNIGSLSLEDIEGQLGNLSAVEIGVLADLKQSGMVMAKITALQCGPDSTTYIGQRTFCEAEYDYVGIPGSALSMLRWTKPGRARHVVVHIDTKSEVSTSVQSNGQQADDKGLVER